MISPKTAFKIVLKHVRPLKTGRKPLADALDCCLAEDIRADRDMPQADRSAMDGFAVIAADIANCPCELRLIGEVAAGSDARPKVRPGTCARVLTGGNVPPGADTVVMVENTDDSGDVVTFNVPQDAGINIRWRGEEAKKGTVLLGKGTTLSPNPIGLCASVGKAHVKVYRRPRVAVLCTGEELLTAADKIGAHQLRDSNGPALCAALRTWGFAEITHKLVSDDIKILSRELKRAADRNDVVLLTGGVSVGDYDYVPEATKIIGAVTRFHCVKMKPGKPTLYATLPRNRHIFGLPGNPLSAMNGFFEFVLPALRRMSGVPQNECRPAMTVSLAAPVRAKSGRTEYPLVQLISTPDGLQAMPIKSRGSADLVAGSRASGIVVIPAEAEEVPAGAPVEFRPWRRLS